MLKNSNFNALTKNWLEEIIDWKQLNFMILRNWEVEAILYFLLKKGVIALQKYELTSGEIWTFLKINKTSWISMCGIQSIKKYIFSKLTESFPAKIYAFLNPGDNASAFQNTSNKQWRLNFNVTLTELTNSFLTIFQFISRFVILSKNLYP